MLLPLASPAWAQAPASAPPSNGDEPEMMTSSEPPDAELVAPYVEPDLEWWPWLATVPLLATSLAIDLTVSSDTGRWRYVGPVDRAFESWARDTVDGRHRAALASDFFLFSSAAAPVADAILWSQNGTRRSRVTYRLLTMDSLAFAFQGLLVVGTKHAVRRPRPYDVRCTADPEYDPACNSSSRFQSFLSGHAASAFTGAALVCVHQRLRGRTPLGYIECIATLATASFAGALRIVSDRHYVSDVLGGAVIGFLSGYLLPLILYPRALPPPILEPHATAW